MFIDERMRESEIAAELNSNNIKTDLERDWTRGTVHQMARMEAEMQSLQREYQLIEESYGTDVLNHTLTITYLRSLLNNKRITKYLDKHHNDILVAFRNIIDGASM